MARKFIFYFFIVGFIILGISLFAYGISEIRNPQVWIETEGTVYHEEHVRRMHQGRIRSEWDVYVRYVVDGEMFRARFGSLLRSHGVGSEITFNRTQADPRNVSLGTPLSGTVLIVLGVILFTLAGVVIALLHRKRK